MNDSTSWPGLSRRGFLGAATGAAAAAMLPAGAARAAITPAGAPRAAVEPVAGATVNPVSYGVNSAVDAANIADSYIGLPLALTIQKFWTGEGKFPAEPAAHMKQLSGAGCQLLISAQPSRTLSATQQSELAAWLTMLKNAGISYRVVLWSECNNTAFPSVDAWLAYWSYYAPVIQSAGVSCGYNPGCGFALARALTYFPSDPTPDELWMDYYATGFRRSSRLDQLIALAHSSGVSSAGLAEWGWSAGDQSSSPMSIPWWNDYCSYLAQLGKKELLNLGAIYFGSKKKGVLTNVIGSSSDPRIPGMQKVSAAVQTMS